MVQHEGRRYLVDCGEGTQRQLLKSGIGLRRLDTVLLTHGHLDHLLGLGGLASTLGLWRATTALRVFGGAEPTRLARVLLEEVVWSGTTPNLKLSFSAISGGRFLEHGALTVTAFPVRHRAPDCFGYRFETRPRRSLLQDRVTALGIPNGPERSQLVAGRAVTLSSGRRIEPDEVLGPERRGVSLAILGDAGSTDDLVEHVRGVDLLVSEATFLQSDAEKAADRGHLTARQAAGLAQKAGVGHLCLTHLSDRYDPAAILAEAAETFPATTLARDFLTLSVGAEGVAEKPPSRNQSAATSA